MLPSAYAPYAAIVLVVAGLIACFAGYRLFRFVLGLFGFVLGAAVASSMMGTSSTTALIVAALVGGLVGSILMVAAYFVGVGLVGAFLGALVVNAVWRFVGGEPPTLVLVIVCVLGALAALSVVRYVAIFGTALAGSWALLVGALALFGHRPLAGAASPVSAGSGVWILYPLDPMSAGWWVIPAWLVLALMGVIVQLATTTKMATRKTVKAQKA
jgi:hypothetical protein